MDDSAPNVTHPTDSPPPPQHWVVARALASAAVFGTIGQYIGHRLGRDLNNKVVEPTLRWSMGSFWALLAAYSSLKASEIEGGKTVTGTLEPAATVTAKAPEMQIVPNAQAPLSLIEVDTMKDDGKLETAPPLQLAGK